MGKTNDLNMFHGDPETALDAVAAASRLLLDMAEYAFNGGEFHALEELLRIDNAVRRQLGTLRQQAATYRQNFRMLLSSQMQLLDDSGLGREKADEPAAPSAPARSATIQRIDLVQDAPAPRKIVPIPQEDD